MSSGSQMLFLQEWNSSPHEDVDVTLLLFFLLKLLKWQHDIKLIRRSQNMFQYILCQKKEFAIHFSHSASCSTPLWTLKTSWKMQDAVSFW